MYWTSLLAVTFVVSVQGVLSKSMPHETITEEDVRNNLIGYNNDLVEGLTPPLLEAENHFKLQPTKSIAGFENPYVVEIHTKHLNIKTAGLPSQKIMLNKTETQGIQKVSLLFVKLLNSSKLLSQTSEVEPETTKWSKMNPVIILTNSGISIQFLNNTEEEPDATEVSPENRRILWDFLTKYARNIFEEKMKDLHLSEKYAEVLNISLNHTGSSAFQSFVDFLWNTMRLSVNYAETVFDSWTTPQSETTALEVEKKYHSSTATLFAYEEPSPFHEFPSQEFQHRRKDIDSIFYGRGVV